MNECPCDSRQSLVAEYPIARASARRPHRRGRGGGDETAATCSRSGMRRVDAVVVGAGFGGLYMVHKLRGLQLDSPGFEPARMGLLVLERLSRRAVRRGEPVLQLLLRSRAGAGMGVDRTVPPLSPRSCVTWATSPTGLTCVAGTSSTPPSRRRAGQGADEVDGGTDQRDCAARSSILATGSLSAAKAPDIAGGGDSPGRCPYTSSSAR
ncbi:hypothetical protein AB5I41_08510 [Sphingomonas sp. MMS24-JH45]